MIEIVSLSTGVISIVVAVISIVLSIKMNNDTEKLLKKIENIVLDNQKNIGIAENDLRNI